MKCFLFLIIVLFVHSTQACEEWFSKLKIKDSTSCEEQCRIAQTDMSSFMCPQECKSLCAKKFSNQKLNIYGLTDDEIAFCKNNLIKCLQAYKLTWSAEQICLDMYTHSETNDETDACRHYAWAILMAKEIGRSDAESILNAHENNPLEPVDEKAMDLANNRLALLDFEKNQNKKIDEKIIKSLFLENLKKKRFIIINPRFESSGGLP